MDNVFHKVSTPTEDITLFALFIIMVIAGLIYAYIFVWEKNKCSCGGMYRQWDENTEYCDTCGHDRRNY